MRVKFTISVPPVAPNVCVVLFPPVSAKVCPWPAGAGGVSEASFAVTRFVPL